MRKFVLFMLVVETFAFLQNGIDRPMVPRSAAPSFDTGKVLSKNEDKHDNDVGSSRRRHILLLPFAVPALVAPTGASAVKPRNEQLCGTGLFTNYLEYRCTELGDISDEGQRTSFSAKEEGAADSLLGKLNLDFDNTLEQANVNGKKELVDEPQSKVKQDDDNGKE